MLALIIKLIMFGGFLCVGIEGCNEAVCASVVTKCLLTKSCSCDLETSTCSRDCFKCLGHKYTECCSCIDMCPQESQEVTKPLSKNSDVHDFINPVPQLFNVLTEYPDELERWEVIAFPIEIEVNQYSTTTEVKLHTKTSEEEPVPFKPDTVTLNCTVVFWAQCMSTTKCENSCLSMGSSGYRWFHDGCCECIGQYCINYGLSKSKCKSCPLADDSGDIENLDEEDYDYGEDEFEEYDENEETEKSDEDGEDDM